MTFTELLVAIQLSAFNQYFYSAAAASPSFAPTVPQAFYTRKPVPTTGAPSILTGSPTVCPLIHPTRVPSLAPSPSFAPTVPQAFFTRKPTPTTGAPSILTGSPTVCPLIHPTSVPSLAPSPSFAPTVLHVFFTRKPAPTTGLPSILISRVPSVVPLSYQYVHTIYLALHESHYRI